MKSSELLQKVRDQMPVFESRVAAAVSGLGPNLQEKTSAHDWSALGIIEHMVIAHEPVLRAIEAGVRSGVQGPDDELRLSWVGAMLVKFNRPESHAPAPRFLHPAKQPLDATLLDRWRAQLARASELSVRCTGLDLNRSRVRNPYIRFLRQSVGDCFSVLLVHLERHVRQVEAVCAELRKPTKSSTG